MTSLTKQALIPLFGSGVNYLFPQLETLPVQQLLTPSLSTVFETLSSPRAIFEPKVVIPYLIT